MNVSVTVALITAAAALVTAVISLVAQRRTAAYQDTLLTEGEKRNRAEELRQLMLKYRQPMLQATTDLQSRLFNIVRGNFLRIYGCSPGAEGRYAVENTLFVFGEYFGWLEALRREVQFLDIGGEEENRNLQACIEHVASEFLRDDLEPEFRLFRGQQRAIGEVMLAAHPSGTGSECVGFAKFTAQLHDPQVRQWFQSLIDDLDRLSKEFSVVSRRMVLVQRALVDLMDLLDPSQVRIPPNRRTRLEEAQSK